MLCGHRQSKVDYFAASQYTDVRMLHSRNGMYTKK